MILCSSDRHTLIGAIKLKSVLNCCCLPLLVRFYGRVAWTTAVPGTVSAPVSAGSSRTATLPLVYASLQGREHHRECKVLPTVEENIVLLPAPK